MEKRRAHYDLGSIKASFTSPKSLRISRTAHDGALQLGLTLIDVVAIVQSMQTRHLYKSMTSIHDPRTWQDVYHVGWNELLLYVKITIDDEGYFVVSFKEK